MNDQFVDDTEHVLAPWRAEEDAVRARLAAEVVAMRTLPPRRRRRVSLSLLITPQSTPVPQPRASNAGIAAGTRALLSLSALIGSSVLFLTGCSSAPSRNILGSYFPSWMICALIGMGATIAVRALLAKTGIDAALPMPIVVYLAFATAFSLAIWLLWLA